MKNKLYSQQAHWQREFIITQEWQDKLPAIWQLHKKFEFKIMQCAEPLAVCGERTFLLAQETQCHNGMRTIKGLVYLTPGFKSLAQLERYTSEHSVEILYAHFYGHQTSSNKSLIAG